MKNADPGRRSLFSQTPLYFVPGMDGIFREHDRKHSMGHWDMKTRTQSVKYRAPAVQRAFQMLKVVAESPAAYNLSDLARSLGWSKSTTHGLIQSLMNIGALEQCPQENTFVLGPVVADLAFQDWQSYRVSGAVTGILESLRDRIQETVFLGVMGRRRTLIVAASESTKHLKLSAHPGTAIALLAGALGKLYLASLTPEAIQRFLKENELPRYTERSITEKNRYLSEIERVSQDGYALDNEEYLAGVRAVAVSIGNRGGLPMALWVVGFAAVLEMAHLTNMIDDIQAAARDIRHAVDREGKPQACWSQRRVDALPGYSLDRLEA